MTQTETPLHNPNELSSDLSSNQFSSEINHASEISQKILNNIEKKVLGQDSLKKRFLTAIITEGHLLLEGVPGLAKTLAIKTLAESVDASFARIQFTPDLLPADLIGTEIFRPSQGDFVVRKGPVFANFVLADEINRAPAKVQSALLEVMQEKQVTIAGVSSPLPKPFMVLATQNPVEQEGTYPLPEAQIDRFIMKVVISYPSKEEEFKMLESMNSNKDYNNQTEPVSSKEDLEFLKNTAKKVYIDERIQRYIIDLVDATRNTEIVSPDFKRFIELGASPRASISLMECARAEALLQGESFVRPEFIKEVAKDVLGHRIMLSYEAEAEDISAANLVEMLLENVEVP